jgi:predicted kinase
MAAQPLVVIAGPPGAGKTTVSRLVAMRFEPPACLIESDWWWTTIVKGHIPPWLPEAEEQNRTVVRSFAAAAVAMAGGGFPTVLEGVIGPWMLDEVLSLAAAARLQVHYVVLRPTLEVSLHRATSRAGEERVAGHPALSDPEPVRMLWHQFADLGQFERNVVDNTSMRPDEAAEHVFELVRTGAAVVHEGVTAMPAIYRDETAVPGLNPSPDPKGPLMFTLDVDGEQFAVYQSGPGDWSYQWLTGPNAGYGFGASGPAVHGREEHETRIRLFLRDIDPATGFMED